LIYSVFFFQPILSSMKHAYPSTISGCAKAFRGRAASWLSSGLSLLFVLGAQGAQAQQRSAPALFQDDAAARQAAAQSPLSAALRQSRPLTIDATAMRTALAAAPLEGRAGATPLLFTMPLPNGTTEQC
jgi:hypothetical protein